MTTCEDLKGKVDTPKLLGMWMANGLERHRKTGQAPDETGLDIHEAYQIMRLSNMNFGMSSPDTYLAITAAMSATSMGRV
jgi:hypothetical protein